MYEDVDDPVETAMRKALAPFGDLPLDDRPTIGHIARAMDNIRRDLYAHGEAEFSRQKQRRAKRECAGS